MSEITRILKSLDRGEEPSSDKLLRLVYEELRVLARSRLDREKQHSVQPTELVHEAYLRLVGNDKAVEWSGRSHFFGAAAEAMRRIMIERARRRLSQKQGGNMKRIELTDELTSTPVKDTELVELDGVLAELEQQSEEHATLVKLRFFAGLTNQEVADILGISTATAQRKWAFARAWLHRKLSSTA